MVVHLPKREIVSAEQPSPPRRNALAAANNPRKGCTGWPTARCAIAPLAKPARALGVQGEKGGLKGVAGILRNRHGPHLPDGLGAVIAPSVTGARKTASVSRRRTNIFADLVLSRALSLESFHLAGLTRSPQVMRSESSSAAHFNINCRSNIILPVHGEAKSAPPLDPETGHAPPRCLLRSRAFSSPFPPLRWPPVITLSSSYLRRRS